MPHVDLTNTEVVADILETAQVHPRFNVVSYGATGDGVTDDTAAIQSTIDACELAGGGEVFFPPHVTNYYLTTAKLKINGSVRIQGSGIDVTEIRNDTTGLIVFGETTSAGLSGLEDIKLRTGSSGGHVIDFTGSGASNGIFKHCFFRADSTTSSVIYFNSSTANVNGWMVLACRLWNTSAALSVPLVSVTLPSGTGAFNNNNFIGGWMQISTTTTAPVIKLSTPHSGFMYRNTFQGILFERGRAGVIHVDGQRGLSIRDCGVYDIGAPATASMFVFDKHADGHFVRYSTIENTFRIGDSVGAFYDIEMKGGSAFNTVTNSGSLDPASGKINFGHLLNTLINPSAATLSGMSAATVIHRTYLTLENMELRGGTATPEGAVTAPIGSTFMRSNGGRGTSLYTKASGAPVAAQGTLTLDTIPADTNTLTVDARVYTFQSTLTDVDGNIKIGANLAATKANLVAAFARGGTPGTDYADKMTVHLSVTMAAFVSDDAVLTAVVAGTGGNSIVTTETFTPAGNIFDATTLGTTTTGSGDVGWLGIQGIDAQSNASRGNANAVPVGYEIFNTDDAFPNWSDGTNWKDATGSTT